MAAVEVVGFGTETFKGYALTQLTLVAAPSFQTPRNNALCVCLSFEAEEG